ncbi:AraC family transcriptional regulator [Phocaeicola sp.]
MDISANYTIALTPLIPFFSAIACGILVAFSLQDCLKREERKLKRIVLFYLSVAGIGWFVAFCYEFIPVLFVWMNIVCLISFILPAILFYRIVRYLTRLEKPENFSLLHYLLPGLLVVVMLIWCLCVPFSIQLELVTGKAQVFPVGYETFSCFFTVKPLLRVIFGLVYYLLAIRVLADYYKRATRKKRLVRKPAKWMLFLVSISLASLFSSVLPTFMPRSEFYTSTWTVMVALSIAAQHVLLSYHIIRRDYLLYIIPGKPHEPPKVTANWAEEPQVKPERRQHSGKLDRQRFEDFIHNEKPYLKPDYKITDLVDDLDVNRTALSAFVNRTYGMNFNRYLNRLRLKELERLRSLPENQGKSVGSLLSKIGYKDIRNYSRAAAAEREAKKQEGDTE